MLNGQVHTIFATPMFVSTFHDRKKLDDILNFVKSLEYKDKTGQTENKMSSNTFVLNLPELKELKIYVEDALKYFMQNVIQTEQTLKITQSWVNYSEKGKTHTFHTHPNSIFSGVFYLQSDLNSPYVTFFNRIPNQYQFESRGDTPFTGNIFRCNPDPGSLIIFPSNLPHAVETNTSDTPRISLSFNTFVNDKIGSMSALTYVEA